MQMQAHNTIGSSVANREEIQQVYNTAGRRDKSAMFYRKVSKVIKNPEREARRLRAQMSKEVYPFVTVNQLIHQRTLAEKQGEEERFQAISYFLEEMVRQELEDGFPGTVSECLAYLKKNVAVGRLYAANIEAVYKQYTVDFKEDPFIHLPKVRKAYAVSAELATSSAGHAYVNQHMGEMIGYVTAQERSLGYEGSDEELLEKIHSWELK